MPVLNDKFTLPRLGAIPAKRFKIEWVLFDILRSDQQRALFMVGGFITTLHDSIRKSFL